MISRCKIVVNDYFTNMKELINDTRCKDIKVIEIAINKIDRLEEHYLSKIDNHIKKDENLLEHIYIFAYVERLRRGRKKLLGKDEFADFKLLKKIVQPLYLVYDDPDGKYCKLFPLSNSFIYPEILNNGKDYYKDSSLLEDIIKLEQTTKPPRWWDNINRDICILNKDILELSDKFIFEPNETIERMFNYTSISDNNIPEEVYKIRDEIIGLRRSKVNDLKKEKDSNIETYINKTPHRFKIPKVLIIDYYNTRDNYLVFRNNIQLKIIMTWLIQNYETYKRNSNTLFNELIINKSVMHKLLDKKGKANLVLKEFTSHIKKFDSYFKVSTMRISKFDLNNLKKYLVKRNLLKSNANIPDAKISDTKLFAEQIEKLVDLISSSSVKSNVDTKLSRIIIYWVTDVLFINTNIPVTPKLNNINN